MRQTELHLTDEDRKLIDSYRASGLHEAREVNRTHVLSALDRGVPEAQVKDVAGTWKDLTQYCSDSGKFLVF